MRLAAAVLALALAAAAGLLALPPPIEVQDDGRGRGVVYPLVVHDGAPYVELAPGGRPGLFLLDTGANGSAVDEGWLRSSSIPTREAGTASVLGTTGALQAPRVTIERLDVGNGFFLDPVLNVQRYGAFARPDGRVQAGLIGTDLLGCYAVRLDYEKRVVELALRGERRRPPWEAVPVQYVANLPTVEVVVGPVRAPCRLDTGASYRDPLPFLDVNRAFVSALLRSGTRPRPRGAVHVLGVSGPERLEFLDAGHALELGPARIAGVVLVVHERGTLAGPEPLALAGAPILARLGRFQLDPFDRTLRVPRFRRGRCVSSQPHTCHPVEAGANPSSEPVGRPASR